MSTRPDDHGPLGPHEPQELTPRELEPQELEALETAARRALHEEAGRLVPQDRSADIRAAAVTGETRTSDASDAGRPGDVGRSRRPDWFWPLVSAAAVAVVAVGAWGALVSRPTPVTGAATVPVATSSAPTPAATASGPTTVPPSTPAPSPATSLPSAGPGVATTAFPAYFVEQVAGTSYGLVREFVPSSSGARLGTAEGAAESARLSMAATPAHATGTVVSAWSPGTTLVVSVQGGRADVQLSRAGRTGLPAAQQRLAVQQLVWAVTAGLQRTVPVGVAVAGGGTVFETVPAGTFARPATDQSYLDVAPVWVDSPLPGATYATTARVTVTGQACAVEGTVSWVLEQGSATVRTGHTTATSGCPVMGSWTVDLDPLPAGSYTLHVRTLSAEDGSVRGDQQVAFTVR